MHLLKCYTKLKLYHLGLPPHKSLSSTPFFLTISLAIYSLPISSKLFLSISLFTVQNVTSRTSLLLCGKQDCSSICRSYYIWGNRTPSLHAYRACVEAACHGSRNSDCILHKRNSSSGEYCAHFFVVF